jgi:hypothetical protein
VASVRRWRLRTFSRPAPSLTNSQQEKMKECNADATTKSLSGDERKSS